MRRIGERAPHKTQWWPQAIVLAAGLLLASCAGQQVQGILPQTEMPPAPPGPAPAYPSFNAPDTGDDEASEILTNVEQQELEARLSKLPADREATVKHRIERAK